MKCLAYGVLVLAVSACSPTASPSSEQSEPSGMWSGVHARARQGVASLKSADEPSQRWAPELSEQERARCKEVAWQAVVSPDTWARYFEFPESAEGLTELSEKGIQYYLDQRDFSTVDVAIPSGALVGWHPTYIGVTVARGSYEVLSMYSSFWP
ncbi:MAG: hypothetical protein ACKVXR_14555 [Planctomycetota bacterium]